MMNVKWRFAHLCTQAITHAVSYEVEVLRTTMLKKNGNELNSLYRYEAIVHCKDLVARMQVH